MSKPQYDWSGGLDSTSAVAESRPGSRLKTIAVCFFLALAVWLVFGQTVQHGFVNYDDPDYVAENPAIARGISLGGVSWAFTHRHSDNWHPLTSMSHMLDCEFYGLNPAGHHLSNVLLHAATVILLFLMLRSMTGVFWSAAFVAAVFAVHPLRVESVAWVSERKDILSGLFFMLTLWTYVCHVKWQKSKSPTAFVFLASPCYWLALAFFACGLMSKPMLVTLPFVLMLLDYWPLNRVTTSAADFRFRGWYGLVLEKILFLLLTIASCTATIWAQKNVIRTVDNLGFHWRIGNALEAYVAYIGQMLCPLDLAVFYPHPQNHLNILNVGISALVLVVITAAVVAARRQRPYLLVGWFWYLGMLVPVIGIMQVGDQARADRYTYLPQIGLSIMIVWVAVDWSSSWRHRRGALGVVAMVILAGLTALAFDQVKHWKDSLSLWKRALECAPDNAVARCSFGLALANQGRWDEAIYNYKRALQFKEEYGDAHNNLGIALAARKDWDGAIAHYERALQLKPNFASAHVNLGVALAARGQLEAAMTHYRLALQIKPDLTDGWFNFGNLLARQKKWSEAIPHYERALELKPDLADAHLNLGIALVAGKNWNVAIRHFDLASQLQPDSALVYYNWANTLSLQGDLAGAIQHFQKALNLAVAQNDSGLVENILARIKSCQTVLSPPQTH